MELDNHNSRQAYIHLLVATLKKKLEILNKLMDLTQQQESLLSNDGFLEDTFLKLMDQKEEHLKELQKLDNGFENIYNSVRDELITGKEKYIAEISQMKETIGNITNLSVRLQALEKRNKSNVEVLLSRKRQDIKRSRISNQTVSNYYKSISQQENQSFFYDKKK